MSYNILLPSLKIEHPGPTYYLSPANISGLVIHDASNNICSVYTWAEFEGKKGVYNIASFRLCCFNYKGWYSQSYGKNNKMPEIAILVDNCGGQNNNNVTIRFLYMIKEGEFFGTDTFHPYFKIQTKNDCERSFNSLKVL